jgi:serine/threonine-protein kinase
MPTNDEIFADLLMYLLERMRKWRPEEIEHCKLLTPVYRVLTRLGEGGFGFVYLVTARQSITSAQTVALSAVKILREGLIVDDKRRELFREEAGVWINIPPHPHIVRAANVVEIGGRICIEMEYVHPSAEGAQRPGMCTLQDYLLYEPPNLLKTLKWSIQICRGMEHAYSHGVKSHRDLKPTNIMIDMNKTAKITDFGLAGVLAPLAQKNGINVFHHGKEVGASYSSLVGTGFGTPPYMPPEQFENALTCDERSDIYAFGVMLYQMVAKGRFPFSLPSPPRRGASHEQKEQYWQDVYDAHRYNDVSVVDSPLFAHIEKCIQKDREARYQSFAALRLELEKLLTEVGGGAVSAPTQLEQSADVEWIQRASWLLAIGLNDKALDFGTGVRTTWIR